MRRIPKVPQANMSGGQGLPDAGFPDEPPHHRRQVQAARQSTPHVEGAWAHGPTTEGLREAEAEPGVFDLVEPGLVRLGHQLRRCAEVQ